MKVLLKEIHKVYCSHKEMILKKSNQNLFIKNFIKQLQQSKLNRKLKKKN